MMQNFLVDGTGHVKLTDFGLATGALNPQRIESMRNKVSRAHRKCAIDTELTVQLDQVKDEDLVMRSTLERRTLYRSMRMAEPRYVCRCACYAVSMLTRNRPTRSSGLPITCLLRCSVPRRTPILLITGHSGVSSLSSYV